MLQSLPRSARSDLPAPATPAAPQPAGAYRHHREQWRSARPHCATPAALPFRTPPDVPATAHYWARELGALGHEVRLMPAQYVKAYIKRNKHDAADAEAICEAVGRPTATRRRGLQRSVGCRAPL